MKLRLRLLVTLTTLLLLSFNLSSFGQATVTTDKDDYPPRSTAIFTGAGFEPGETVVLKVKNLSYPCNTVFADSSYLPWSVVADADGGFVTEWLVCECPGDSLRLKATGQSSGSIALAYFLDNQLGNNAVSVSTTPTLVTGTGFYGSATIFDYTVTVTASNGGSANLSTVTLSMTTFPTGITAGMVQFLPSASLAIGNSLLPYTATVRITTQANTPVPTSPTFVITATPVSGSSRTASGTLALKPVVLTPVLDAADRDYDGTTNATLTQTDLSGILFGDNVTLSATGAQFVDQNIGVNKTVNVSGLSLGGTKASNYTVASTGTALATISPKPLIAIFTIANKVYDGTTAATITDRQLSGQVAGETQANKVALTGGVATFDTKNVGSGKTVTVVNPMSLTGSASGNYVIGSVQANTAAITFRTATIVYTVSDKVYDGNTSATILSAVVPPASTNPTNGLIAGDNVTVDFATAVATFGSAAAGTGKAVSASGFKLVAAGDGPAPGLGNYQVNAATSFSSTGNITPRPVTVTFTTSSKTYDGTRTATINSWTLVNAVTGDAIGVNGGTATYDTKNVGTGKTVSASGFTLTGSTGMKANYQINPNSATYTQGVITIRNITATAVTDSRVYNGTTSSNKSPLVAGLQLGDAPQDAITTAPTQVYNDKNVGTGKTLTPSGMVISDGNSGLNYNIIYVTNTTGIITAKGINVTAATDSRVYNGTTSSDGVPVVDDLETGDVVLTAPTQAYANKNVGTGKTLTPSGLEITDGNNGNNYTVTYVDNITGIITAKDINVTAKTDSRIYNGTTSSNKVPTVDALETGDVVGTQPTQTYDDRNVGTGKTLTPAGLVINDGNGGNNYSVHYVDNSTGTISQKSINVTAQTDSRTYNGTASSSVVPVVDDLETGDVVGTAPIQVYNNKNVGTSKTMTASGLIVNDGNGGANYDVHYVTNGTGVITAKDINVTAQTDSRVYNGTTSSDGIPVVDDLETGDVVLTAPTQAYANKNVGTGKTLIPAGLVITDGNSGHNYNVSYVNNTTGVITAKAINVTAKADSRVYNSTTSSAVVPTVDALETGDQIGTAPKQVFDNKNVGTGKTLTPSGLIVNDGNSGNNYAITYVARNCGTITAKSVTAAISASNKNYDGNTTASAIGSVPSGIFDGDVVTINVTNANFAFPDQGTWTVTANVALASTGDGGNYVLTSGIATTTATINPLSITPGVTVSPTTQQYSDKVTFTATIPNGAIGVFAATSATFKVGTQIMGTANFVQSGVNLVATLSDVRLVEPSPFGTTPTGQMAPGTRDVSAVINSPNANYAFTTTCPKTPITINPEDARVTYTGMMNVATTTTTGSAVKFNLIATVQDISVTADAGTDSYKGNIRNAKVTFINRDNNTVIAANVPVGLVNANDSTTGTATYEWSTTMPTSGLVTVGIIVTNYYTRDASCDNVVINMYQPNGDFITGGGYLTLTSATNGMKAGDPGSKNNFGFNIKYNKSGTNLQGNINSIIRRTENGVMKTFQIKGNAMASLSVDISKTTSHPYPTAVFTGKANITDITNPLAPISLEGGATLQVSMTDAGEPGSNDMLGIVVYNKAGGVWYSSNWSGTKTVEQKIAGGNLLVHSSSAVKVVSAPTTARVALDQTARPEFDKFKVKVLGNPSNSYFIVQVESSTYEPVEIAVFDMSGKHVRSYRGAIGESFRIGHTLAQGMYMMQVLQGTNKSVTKLIKD